MHDGYNRSIDYLRVSVTDRCNFRCAYCMPPEGLTLLDHKDILSYEEFLRLISILSRHGIRKVRITGGEPLVRKGIVEFIAAIKAMGTIADLSLTTNGSLLAHMADDLKQAGLDRVNVSLDTLDPKRFRVVTGNMGRLEDTLAGIDAAFAAGLEPVKVNAVLTAAFTERDLIWFVDKICHYRLAVRFIEYMPIGHGGIKGGFSVAEVKQILEKIAGPLEPVTNTGKGNGPAKYFRLSGAQGFFGFITPLSEHFCGACNRIRLTADGKFRPCLLSNKEIDVKLALRSGASDDQIADLFYRTIEEKPASHTLCRPSGHTGFQRKMSQIGG